MQADAGGRELRQRGPKDAPKAGNTADRAVGVAFEVKRTCNFDIARFPQTRLGYRLCCLSGGTYVCAYYVCFGIIVLYLALVLPLPPPPQSFAARPCHVAMAMPVGSIPGAVMLQYCTLGIRLFGV